MDDCALGQKKKQQSCRYLFPWFGRTTVRSKLAAAGVIIVDLPGEAYDGV
jgi:hypothetical protein